METAGNEFYRGKRVLVTGGRGFLGRHVVQSLIDSGTTVRVTTSKLNEPEQRDFEIVHADLSRIEDCRRAVASMDCVFHLAAFGWGLGENVKLHSQLFTNNVLVNTCMLEAAHQAGVSRYLYASSSAVYDGTLSVLDDEQSWSGNPHPSEFAFGWAKRAGEVQAQIYAAGGSMKIAVVRPSNPYGPGDDFHPTRAHVIPSLIIRAFARERPFVVWGTGGVERSFVHVRDVTRAMLLALEKYAVCDPVNIASPEITTIAQVAEMIIELSGHRDADLVFDASKPEGHPGKYPSVKKAADRLGFRAGINLRDGLQDTISWYRSTLANTSW